MIGTKAGAGSAPGGGEPGARACCLSKQVPVLHLVAASLGEGTSPIEAGASAAESLGQGHVAYSSRCRCWRCASRGAPTYFIVFI